MRRALATLAIGDVVLHPKSLASFEAAAARWDASLIIFREPLADCHIWWQKTFAIDFLQSYDEVLQLDADMLIAENCPAPWSLVDSARVGVCRDLQHPNQYRLTRWLANQGKRWSVITGLQQPGGRQCVQAGLLLYAPRVILPWFRLWQSLGRSQGFPAWGLGDQSVLCLLAVNFRIHNLLADRWNLTHAGTGWRPDLPAQMDGTIYHFCGRHNRLARIDATEWRTGETANPPPVFAGKSADQDTVP